MTLRDELAKIVQIPSAEDWPAAVERLRVEHGHSIHVLQSSPFANYNCFTFAFGLHKSPRYRFHALTNNLFPNPEFVKFLLGRGALQPAADDENNLLLIYFANGEPAHAGQLQGGLVTSKWGTGSLYKHPILQVPASYGTETRSYDLLEGSQAEAEFGDWVALKLGA